MNIEELISGKDDSEKVELGGISIPVNSLKSLMQEGYVNLRPEPKSKSVVLWGKTVCACFREVQLQERV
jgi:hypothetical protein